MEEGLSDFLKLAYEKGKVKEVKDAFYEYPVEEEWHQGKIENILCEDTVQYSPYDIGDIVFVKEYYYQNGEKGQNHLFVIVDQNNMAVPIENFGMLISSQLEKIKFEANKLLPKDDNNKLKRDSVVKTDVIYRITNNQILFKIGSVDKQKIEEYKESFLKYLNAEK